MSCRGLVSVYLCRTSSEQMLVQLSCMQCDIDLLVLHAGTADLQASRTCIPSFCNW